MYEYIYKHNKINYIKIKNHIGGNSFECSDRLKPHGERCIERDSNYYYPDKETCENICTNEIMIDGKYVNIIMPVPVDIIESTKPGCKNYDDFRDFYTGDRVQKLLNYIRFTKDAFVKLIRNNYMIKGGEYYLAKNEIIFVTDSSGNHINNYKDARYRNISNQNKLKMQINEIIQQLNNMIISSQNNVNEHEIEAYTEYIELKNKEVMTYDVNRSKQIELQVTLNKMESLSKNIGKTLATILRKYDSTTDNTIRNMLHNEFEQCQTIENKINDDIAELESIIEEENETYIKKENELKNEIKTTINKIKERSSLKGKPSFVSTILLTIDRQYTEIIFKKKILDKLILDLASLDDKFITDFEKFTNNPLIKCIIVQISINIGTIPHANILYINKTKTDGNCFDAFLFEPHIKKYQKHIDTITDYFKTECNACINIKSITDYYVCYPRTKEDYETYIQLGIQSHNMIDLQYDDALCQSWVILSLLLHINNPAIPWDKLYQAISIQKGRDMKIYLLKMLYYLEKVINNTDENTYASLYNDANELKRVIIPDYELRAKQLSNIFVDYTS